MQEKNREMFMIMNSTNIKLPNCSSGCSTLLHIKSCAAFNSLPSILVSDTDKYSSLSTEQYEVAGSEVSDWIVVCTHFCYNVAPCFYCMMGLDGTLRTFVGSSYNFMLLKQKQKQI